MLSEEITEPKPVRRKTHDVWGHVEVRRDMKTWEPEEDILITKLVSGDSYWFENICAGVLEVTEDLLHSYPDARLVRLTIHVYRPDKQGRNRTFKVTHIADRSMIGEKSDTT